MRTIGVVTTSRADYSIYLPLLHALARHPDLRVQLFVSGMHLSPEFGMTVTQIVEDGFPIAEQIPALLSSDTPEAIALSMGIATMGFARAFARTTPDLLVVLGDRFEMHAAVVAATPLLIPVAHIAGGAVTAGAIDDGFRHSMTKLSHLHFAETALYAQRIIQMGEEPWRVTVTGALALDHLPMQDDFTPEEMYARFGIALDEPPLLVTFHPVTRVYQQTEHDMGELLTALAACALPVVFTYPNADTHGRVIITMIERFLAEYPRAVAVPSLGARGYGTMMRHAAAMVGNSSSGIVEAASFHLPVVNIGIRQLGRLHGANVIDVGVTSEAISAGIRQALSREFRASLAGMTNPYGNGTAAAQIVTALATVPLDERLLIKPFHPYGTEQPGAAHGEMQG